MAIAIDFDGVLNTYVKYDGDENLYDPAPGVEEFLKELKKFNVPLIIHTARKAEKVEEWLKEHNLDEYIHTVTNQKVPAIVYIDDRGLKFEGDFKKTIQDLEDFAVWYKSECPWQDWKKDETIYGTLESRGILYDKETGGFSTPIEPAQILKPAVFCGGLTETEDKILEMFSYLFHEGDYLETETGKAIISGEKDHNEVMTIKIKLREHTEDIKNVFIIDLEKEAKSVIKEYENYYNKELTNIDNLTESKVWEYATMTYSDELYVEIKKQLGEKE